MATSRPETFSAEALQTLAMGLLVRSGAPEDNAAEVVASLMEADLQGIPSHGLGLLPLYLDRIKTNSVSPTEAGTVISQVGGAIVMDARNGLGQVTSARAVSLALKASEDHSIGVVAVRNGFHFGTAGRWASMIARHGAVGIAMSNTRPLMPAPGGAEPVVGNNPLAIAVPGQDSDPYLLDFAMSAVAMGKIRIAEAEGRPIEKGWAVDKNGVPTTDAAAAVAGMLLPSAGPKGFGLAMMIDCLCGGLSAGAIGAEVNALYAGLDKPYGCAHLFIAIRVDAFRPLGDYQAASSTFANRIRTSRTAPGVERLMVPGDPALRHAAECRGQIQLPGSTVAALRAAAQAHELVFPPPHN